MQSEISLQKIKIHFRKPFALLSIIEKSKNKGKVENFTLKPYIMDNFAYNMKQFLDSDKGH